jgi:2'-phosphotransferase
MQELDCTVEDVEKVVKESDKQRFEVQSIDGVHCIRAVQGHSIEAVDDEALLKKLALDDSNLPQRCIHGTYRRHLQPILEKGLKPGGSDGSAFRKHVHFSAFAPGDKRVISGMRYDADVAIWIDLRRAIQAGIPFYISENQVILSPGKDECIPSQFFEKVTEVRTGKEIPMI